MASNWEDFLNAEPKDVKQTDSGVYYKKDGSWVRALGVSSMATDADKSVLTSSYKNLADFADVDGKIYMSVDNYGALKLSGLSDDVQTMINNSAAGLAGLNTEFSVVKKESGDTAKLIDSKTGGYSSNLIELVDVNDNTYLTVDSMGGLKLSGLKESAQDMLLKSESTTEKVNATTDISGAKSFALMLVDDNDKLIFGVKNDGSLLTTKKPPLSIKRPYYLRPTVNLHNALQQVSAPVPINHVPMDFDAPDALLSLTIAQPEPCVIDTIYYQDDGVVHPTLLDFYSGFNGHQYWLGITPYHLNDDLFENPFVYVSDDLKNFKQNTDFPQPMAEQPQARDGSSGYNSDIFYTYDFQSNELLVCWRTSRRGTERGSVLSARRTRDGINWSEAEVIYKSQAGESILSPSIVYDHTTKKYLLFCIDGESAGLWGISRREANSLNGEWTNKTFGALDRSVASPWHLDVRYVGRHLVGILNDDRKTNQLYMVKSSDMGVNWDIGVQMITGAQDHAYKATFTPIYDGNKMALQVVWTSNQSATDEDKRWRLFSTQTNFITIAGV